MPEGAFFSHVTAAELLGVPLPAQDGPRVLHVAVPFPRTPPRARGVIGHSLSHVSGGPVDGLPVCAAAQVWCQLAGELCREDLVAAGDHLVGARRRPPLVDETELSAAALRFRRTKGADARAWALPRIRPGADSRPETLLRLFLEDCGVDGLEVNRPVPVLAGALALHPDLSIPQSRIAFEYEGDGHRMDRRQWQRDIERRELMEAEGWRVIRVTARDLFTDRDAFLARLLRFVPNVEFAARPSHAVAGVTFMPNVPQAAS
ncbi:endonuclease domain-containing protein [Leifsonia sp. 22587]|uniref:endonuclease domain-containing protein n=1 Tax=Leifsonia sp. 22587 TaxID=3453946 RepID=UPI003F87EC7D